MIPVTGPAGQRPQRACRLSSDLSVILVPLDLASASGRAGSRRL